MSRTNTALSARALTGTVPTRAAVLPWVSGAGGSLVFIGRF